MRERIRVEALWTLQLGEVLRDHPVASFAPAMRTRLEQLVVDPGETSPATVKAIEKRINHDVKAVEYFVRDEIKAAGATAAQLELVHFGCTSEDINNLSYARLLARARAEQLLPALDALLESVADIAATNAALPCWRARMARPPRPPLSARSSPTSMRACSARATGWRAWKCWANGMEQSAISMRMWSHSPARLDRHLAAVRAAL